MPKENEKWDPSLTAYDLNVPGFPKWGPGEVSYELKIVTDEFGKVHLRMSADDAFGEEVIEPDPDVAKQIALTMLCWRHYVHMMQMENLSKGEARARSDLWSRLVLDIPAVVELALRGQQREQQEEQQEQEPSGT